MRETKFRGKRLDNGEWVTGYLYQLPLPSGVATMILTTDNNHNDNSLKPKYHLAFTLWVDLFPVDAETVGQFTGRNDRSGQEIYDGDIVSLDYEEANGVVVYDDKQALFALHYDDCTVGREYGMYDCQRKELEVVGSIHDNPELINKEDWPMKIALESQYQLNAENVEKVFKECLSTKKEGEGIVYVDAVSANAKFAFSKEKLDLHKTDISAWIDLLPEPFHESKGGGWSFLNMCATKDEKQWTGLHASVEQLLCLAIGTGRMKYLTDRSIWSILPGGMPYVAIIDE